MAEEKKKLEIQGVPSPKANILPDIWNVDKNGYDALVTTAKSSLNSGSSGYYSTIPIKCKGDKCPYIETCYVETYGVNLSDIKGQVCPIEANEVIQLFNRYIEQFKVDDVTDTDQMVVLGLIKDLIDYDIQLRRADRKMMVEADFLEDRCVAVDPSSGSPIYNKEVSKNVEFKERVQKKRHDVLQLLNATPKDKAGSKISITMDPSTYASQLLAKFNGDQENEAEDADYEELSDE